MADPFLTPGADIDYSEAFCWYAERSPRAADVFEAHFERALQAIAAEPQRFPRCDDRHRYYLMRRYPYQIIYREEREKVVIVAVAHARRRPGYWQGR